MEIIILGLLVIKNLTIYEMRKLIETYFSSMCSNSTGSIQTTVKKLLSNGYIIFNEFVENSINKKVYEVTPEGRAYFKSKITEPMQDKEKSIELGKLYYMGFLTKEERLESISSYISDLKKEKEKLELIRFSGANIDTETLVENNIKLLKENNTLDLFKNMLPNELIHEGIQDIAFFQFATLELGIARISFLISWYESLKKKVEEDSCK